MGFGIGLGAGASALDLANIGGDMIPATDDIYDIGGIGKRWKSIRIGQDLTVDGDLTVNGLTTMINSVTLTVDDKNIELASIAIPTDVFADGGGIILKGDTDKTILWNNATDSWNLNQALRVSETGINNGIVHERTDGKFIQFRGGLSRSDIGFDSTGSLQIGPISTIGDIPSGTSSLIISGSGNVGVGVIDPDAKLEINGQIKITGGNPGASKVLTSDANGLATWEIATADVVGPSSSTDSALVRFDLTTGKLIQNSVVVLNDTGVIAGFTQMAISNIGGIADVSSILDLQDTTRGFLPPRMTATQRDAIANPATLLMIGDLTNKKIDFFDGTSWQGLLFAAAGTLAVGSIPFATAGHELNDDFGLAWDNINKELNVTRINSPKIVAAAGNPVVQIEETDAAADEGKWRFQVNAGVFKLETLNDAETAFTPRIEITRSSGSISFKNGNVDISNSLSVGGNVGIGITSPNSTHQVEGSVSRSLATKTSAATLTSLDYTILADAASVAFVISLPTAVGIKGRIYNVKKIDASVNAVTVDANGAETIDGSATLVLADRNESITVQSDGFNWLVL